MFRPINLLAFFLFAVLLCGVASAVRPLASFRDPSPRPVAAEPVTHGVDK